MLWGKEGMAMACIISFWPKHAKSHLRQPSVELMEAAVEVTMAPCPWDAL